MFQTVNKDKTFSSISQLFIEPTNYPFDKNSLHPNSNLSNSSFVMSYQELRKKEHSHSARGKKGGCCFISLIDKRQPIIVTTDIFLSVEKYFRVRLGRDKQIDQTGNGKFKQQKTKAQT